MRKRIKAVSDSFDDEDYVPVDNGISLKELNKNRFWSNLMWYITPTEKKNETKLCKIIKSSFSN